MDIHKLSAYFGQQSGNNDAQAKKLKKQYNFIALLRLLIFIVTAVAFYFALKTTIETVAGLLLAALFVFILLVIKSVKIEQNIRWHRELEAIYTAELKALENDFSAFDAGSEYIDNEHAFSYDLDIFGPGGFFPTLNRTCRPGGKQLLANWLCNPLQDEKQITAQARAFKELSEKDRWCKNFLAYGRIHQLNNDTETQIKSLPGFSLNLPRWMHWALLTKGIPVITGVVLSMVVLHILPFGYLLVAIVAQWGLTLMAGKHIKNTEKALGKLEKTMRSQTALIRMITTQNWDSTVLQKIKNKFISEQNNALKAIQQLASVLKSLEYRNNLIVGFLANSLLLWDIHCVIRFQQWHTRNSSHIRVWMEALDEMDAYISGANYTYIHPRYAWPEHTTEQQLKAINLGHPLIPEHKSVTNDYTLGNGTRFHIITGANMAGKSTFLRTVALNLLMAMTGLPVCADLFRFQPVPLFTSMRTTDSLSDDESYFYAELRRLKRAYAQIKSGQRLFLILDEILKGTNSEDKRQGSLAFLQQLIKYDAAGIVATHDTQLGELAEIYPDQFQNFCFEIEIEGETIHFDYKLQSGITRTMNAQLLMQQMGLIDH